MAPNPDRVDVSKWASGPDLGPRGQFSSWHLWWDSTRWLDRDDHPLVMVDDVFTDGLTLNEVARVLKVHGAKPLRSSE